MAGAEHKAVVVQRRRMHGPGGGPAAGASCPLANAVETLTGLDLNVDIGIEDKGFNSSEIHRAFLT